MLKEAGHLFLFTLKDYIRSNPSVGQQYRSRSATASGNWNTQVSAKHPNHGFVGT